MEPSYAADLRATVARAAEELCAVAPEVVSRSPGTGRWSAKEIVGHLVDSAANNHPRFVSARWRADLVFDGYDQDRWVEAQRYAESPWPELVVLWRTYNDHLARVMASTPIDALLREHERHNLDEIAWRTVPADQRTTLDYLMADYVAHLKHHLRQIAALVPGVTAPAGEEQP